MTYVELPEVPITLICIWIAPKTRLVREQVAWLECPHSVLDQTTTFKQAKSIISDWLADLLLLVTLGHYKFKPQLFRDSFNKGRLPLSCRRAALTLLPMKEHLQQIKSWRPEALLCTDYKILSKVLATRLRKVTEHHSRWPDLLCTQQADIWQCFSNSGHFGPLQFTGLWTWSDFYRSRKGFWPSWTLVLVTETERFWVQLWSHSQDPGLVQWHWECTTINGGLRAPFKVGRGVRQGCSLPGMLYSMAIEPLLHKLRRHLSGINLPGCQQAFKLSAYVDDVVIIVKKTRQYWCPCRNCWCVWYIILC